MKNKGTAILLAFFLGVVGAHRWYLGQSGKAIICIPLGIVGGPIFAIYWALSSSEAFDNEYNKQRLQREMLDALKNK